MEWRRVATAVLTLLVVLAGCAAPVPLGPEAPSTTEPPEDESSTPTATPSPTPTRTPTPAGTPTLEDDVRVENGDLAVDVDLLFARTERLTATDVEPGTVTVRDFDGFRGSAATFTPIYDVLGVGDVQLNRSRPAGLTQRNGDVYFDPAGAGPWLVERRLVHEFVHVVQFREPWLGGPRQYDVELTRDFLLAWRAVAEGGAVYVADAYIERYDVRGPPQSAMLARDYREGTPAGNRIVLAPYHFGTHYVRAQVDSPRDLHSVYERIPKTTEQVLHNETPATEPPMALDVDVDTAAAFDLRTEDRAGEMFLRAVLRAELPRERAAAAAAGWGTDAWLTFEGADPTERGLAWVTRWDAPKEAEEFEQALRTFAERRRANTTGSLRVVRVSADVVALVAGDDAFVDATTVEGEGRAVTVTVDDEAEPASVDEKDEPPSGDAAAPVARQPVS